MKFNKLEDIADIAIGTNFTKFSEDKNGIIKFLRISDIQNGELIKSCLKTYSPKLLENKLNLEKYRVKNEDILITNVGPSVKVCLVSDIDNHTYITSNLFRIRANKDVIYPLFLKYYLESPFGQFQLKGRQRLSTTSVINSDSLKTLPIHYMPYDQQVSLLNKLIVDEHNIHKNINKLNCQLDKVKQEFHKEIGLPDFTYNNESIIEQRKISVVKQIERNPKKSLKSKQKKKTSQKNKPIR